MVSYTVKYKTSNGKSKTWKVTAIDATLKTYIDGKLTRTKKLAASKVYDAKTRAKNYAKALYIKKKEAAKDVRNGMIKPMLAKNAKISDKLDINPAEYILQPKLDGHRALLMFVGKRAIMYSRGRNQIRMQHITEAFEKIAAKHPFIRNYHFDGELYRHGSSLQQISSEVCRATITKTRKHPPCFVSDLVFNVFDAYLPTSPLTFKERHKKVAAIVAKIPAKIAKLVPTHKLRNIGDVNKLLKSYIKEGYEGVVLRKLDSLYHTGTKRSAALIKIKNLQDAEYRLIDFTSGTGAHKDVPILIFETSTHKRFKAKPNLCLTAAKKLLEMLRKNFSRFKGRKYTIRYEALSDTGVPLRASVVSDVSL